MQLPGESARTAGLVAGALKSDTTARLVLSRRTFRASIAICSRIGVE
jgi:hypothetical protein